MEKLMQSQCEERSGGRFDSPRCKNMTVRTASGVPYCGDDHDFETPTEMWERLYNETLWQCRMNERLLIAKSEEISALRKQVAALTPNRALAGVNSFLVQGDIP